MSASGQYQTSGNMNGNIYYSTNYGVIWTPSAQDFSLTWISVAMSASGQYQTAAVIISPRRIYYSTDYGKTWTQTNSVQATWIGVAMSSSGQYMTAVANGDTIYTANIPIPATSYLTNTNLVIGNVRQNTGATGSIVLNASLTTMTGFTGSQCYIKPIRNAGTNETNNILTYNPTTSEVTYSAIINWTQTGPTGFSTNPRSIAANTGPTGTVQAGTGAVFSVYNGLAGSQAINGDIGVTNNLLVAGATIYPDGSAAISNTPPLVYSNNITFTASSQSELNGLSWYFAAMSSSGQYQSACIQGGFIYYSTNYGITWTQSNSGSLSWEKIAMSSSGQYQTAILTNGSIYYSTNYGVNWTITNVPNANWRSIAMSSSGQYQSACIDDNVTNGYIWYSTNYGINWTRSNSPGSRWISIAMSSSGQYQSAAIIGGSIWYSSDYGVSWTESNSSSRNWL
jgi:hypothetical protein